MHPCPSAGAADLEELLRQQEQDAQTDSSAAMRTTLAAIQYYLRSQGQHAETPSQDADTMMAPPQESVFLFVSFDARQMASTPSSPPFHMTPSHVTGSKNRNQKNEKSNSF